MSREKELAYRYDLFFSPGWRERFDTLIDENVELPQQGSFLDVNCGTGAYSIQLAEKLRGKGDVTAVDPDPERISIASAKALAAKALGVTFECHRGLPLPCESDRFDAVIGDASVLLPDEIEPLLRELVRVVKPGGRIVFKLATHGSFDEFFSIYWEALHDCGIDEEVWEALKALIQSRMTVSNAEELAERCGLRLVEWVSKKEEFVYADGSEFLASPIIEDLFLTEWMAILPPDRREEVRSHIATVIDRERHDSPFDVSIKATVLWGTK
jgi:ubiquinone/menaquinone biosynthesis C-methylase UbiE